MKNMIRKKFLLLSIIVSVLAFTACNKAPRQLHYIPKQTASVISVNLPVIASKVDYKNSVAVKKITNYFSNYGFSNETFDLAIRTVMLAADSAGINENSQLLSYIIPSEEFRNAYKCIQVQLADSSLFASYIRTVKSENYDILSAAENCVCYINTNDRFSWVAYNDEVAVFGCSTIHTQGITECINEIFSAKKSSSLASNVDFETFYEQQNDAGLWISTTEMLNYYSLWYKNLPEFLSFKNVPTDALKDNYIQIATKFDKNVQVDVVCNPSSAFKRFWKSSSFSKIPNQENFNELCSHIQNPYWFMSFAVDPTKFLQLFEDSEKYNYVEKELSKLNLTMDDVSQSFTGDCVFSLYDVTLKNVRAFSFAPTRTMVWKHLQQNEQTTFPHIVLGFTLNDSKIPNLILNHISEEICEQIAPGFFDFSKIMGFPLFLVCKDKILLMFTDKDIAQEEYDADYTHPVKLDIVAENLREESVKQFSYHYMDFTVKNYSPVMKDYLQQMNVLSLVESYSAIVKSAKMTVTEDYNGSIVVDFQDTTENSLTQLDNLMQIIIP